MPEQIPLIPLQAARNMMLESLGLLTPTRRKASKADVLGAIRRLHYLQIDTISVVARAHQHILWSRLGSYPVEWIDDLHAEGCLFEYFAHAMSYLPIEDYPLYRWDMLTKRHFNKRYLAWEEAHLGELERMLAYVRETGAVRSADFPREGKANAWWDWKLEKSLLEALFHRGELMIPARKSFQRFYDLRERVLPDWDDAHLPSAQEVSRRRVLMGLKALGIAYPSWIKQYFYVSQAEVDQSLKQLLDEGLVSQARIETLGKRPAYLLAENQPLLTNAIEGRLKPTKTTILSMFDPLLTFRQRARELFNFDYTIEVYTPAPKRVYGYYVLPILHRGLLVGRVDMKAWRKEKRLQVVKLFLEPGEKASETLAQALAKTLRDYATWLGLERVEVDAAQPEAMLGLLRAKLGE